MRPTPERRQPSAPGAFLEQPPVARMDPFGLGLDAMGWRRELSRPDVDEVHATYSPRLLDHPGAADLEDLEPGFRFDFQGPKRHLARRLRPALRDAGVASHKAGEAVVAEIAYLARAMGDLADDPEPRIRLATTGDVLATETDHDAATVLVAPLSRAPRTDSLDAAAAAAALGLPAIPGAAIDAGEILVRRLDRTSTAGANNGPSIAPQAGETNPRLVLAVSSARPVRPLPRAAALLGTSAGPADVVLASLPFGPLFQPSLGLSLLQQTLPDRRVAVLYFNLAFARRVGVSSYDWIADDQPFASAFFGEWLCREALFGKDSAATTAYLDEILYQPTRRWLADRGAEPDFHTLVPQTLAGDAERLRGELDRFLDECVETVLRHQPRVVGLTSVFQQQVASLAFARRLAERAPQLPVVLGGPNCEGVMATEVARRFPFLAAAVSGEGEVVFPELVERLIAGDPVDDLPGVYTPGSPNELEHPPNAPSLRHLDELPVPDYGDFFAQWQSLDLDAYRKPKILFESSRGCWWGEKQHCTFCGLNGMNMGFRSKTPDRAYAELMTLVERHPGHFVGTVDNILDMDYFRTFLPKVAATGLDLGLFYEVKANLKKDQLRGLADAGVHEIQPGVESLDDAVLRLMGKGVKTLQNVQLLKWCHELGVFPLWNIIWGFPGEPPGAYAAMAELLPLLHHLPPPSGMSPIFLERFSPNFSDSEKMGFINVRAKPAYEHIYPFEQEALDHLAYYFHYEYADGRDVPAYTRRVARRIVAWREAHERSRLVVLDRGDHLVFSDTRAMARRQLTLVDGAARELYLACDGIRSLGRLRRLVPGRSRGEVAALLAPLIDDGLMLRRGDSVLALAVPVQAAAPTPQ